MIKFSIDWQEQILLSELYYVVEDCAFDMDFLVQEINFDIVINTINLTVTGDDNKIVQVWGFSGFNEWKISNFEVPISCHGSLKVINQLSHGVGSYKVSEMLFQTYVNLSTNWVCIGDPKKLGNTVEFIKNCIVVIDNDGKFVALWLKPQSLPPINQGISP